MLRKQENLLHKIFATLKTCSRSEGERLHRSKTVIKVGCDVWHHAVFRGHVVLNYGGVLLCSCGKVWDILRMFPPARPNIYFPEESSDA